MLEQTLRLLGQAKARLREVEEGIVTLQAKYEETVAKKEELAEKCNLCSARLERAEKVSKKHHLKKEYVGLIHILVLFIL